MISELPTSTETHAVPKEVDARTLKSWMDQNRVIIVDVRDPEEFAKEHIGGATLRPLTKLDPPTFPVSGAKQIVIHCKSGKRGAEAAARLTAQGRTDIVQLTGGIEAWKAAGLPTEGNPKAPISVMRQVQLVVGSLVLVTTILGAAVSPWFLGLTGFFGAGLIFAGATGTCGMATMLGMAPWNRRFLEGASCSSK